MRVGLRMVSLAVVSALVAGCSGGGGEHDREPRSEAWARSVDRWLLNSQHALRAGIPNVARFLSPDVRVDFRGTAEEQSQGRDAALSVFRLLQARDPKREMRLPAYLSTEGVVVTSHWVLDTSNSGQDAALVLRFSSDGLEHAQSALSVVSGRWRSQNDRSGGLPADWEPLQVIADRYLATWSAGDRGAGASLYAPGVTVADGLLDVRLAGLKSVVDASRRHVDVRLQHLPDLGGPAVFGMARPLEPSFDRVVLLVSVDAGTGCPGRVAVVLELGADGKVTAEERYHRLDDARRCLPPDKRGHGWWDNLRVPDAVALERTRAFVVGDAKAEVWNGTPRLAALLGWAIGQFESAGLPVPEPRSVTFYPVARDRCTDYSGLSSGPGLTELTLCFGDEQACPGDKCPPWSGRARDLVLHEMAHTWLAANLGAAGEQRYVDRVGLPWADPTDPWENRGSERAASTIAWGLDPRHLPLWRFGSPPPAQLAQEFRLLTGQDPLARADPD